MATRRAFIAASAALAASPGLAAAAVPEPKPAQSPIPKLNFDVSAFDALLDRDVSHKHLFTARKLDYGGVLSAIRNTLNAYRDIGVSPAQVASAAVLYHGISILIAMDDYVWDTYVLPLPADMKQKSPDLYKDFETVLKGSAKGNPVLKPKPGDENASVQALAGDGLRLFVCNNALVGFAQEAAKDKQKHPADVYSDIAKHLVPNATAVPAGVWAVHAIQERNYTLLQTS